jgi:hypothetical protein
MGRPYRPNTTHSPPKTVPMAEGACLRRSTPSQCDGLCTGTAQISPVAPWFDIANFRQRHLIRLRRRKAAEIAEFEPSPLQAYGTHDSPARARLDAAASMPYLTESGTGFEIHFVHTSGHCGT